MQKNIFNSYAKINLGLRILDRRNDGFYNIKSIFIKINLKDTIQFIKSKTFSLECNNQNIPIDNTNTIYTAYMKLYEKT